MFNVRVKRSFTTGYYEVKTIQSSFIVRADSLDEAKLKAMDHVACFNADSAEIGSDDTMELGSVEAFQW